VCGGGRQKLLLLLVVEAGARIGLLDGSGQVVVGIETRAE
jgi:hypothetical protein